MFGPHHRSITGAFVLVLLTATTPALEVTTTDDESDSPAGTSVSLREAVRDTPAGGTITFAPSLSGATFTLSSGAIAITGNLTIDATGLAHPPEISGGGTSQIFAVAPSVELTLRGLGVVQGHNSAVWLEGGAKLVAEQCRFAGNRSLSSGGAIHLAGAGELHCTDCTFDDNDSGFRGGAVDGAGPGSRILSFTSSRFTRNSAQSGGAIHLLSSAFTADGCLFAGNTATSRGGGLHLGANVTGSVSNSTFSENQASNGGGLFLGDIMGGTAIAVTNCTITGNRATQSGGGIRTIAGAYTLESVTLVDNKAVSSGGGLHAEADTLVRNSIIAGNRCHASAAHDIDGAPAFLSRSGNNLIGDPGALTSVFPSGHPNAAGDFVGTAASPLRALLSPLGDFGGPLPTRPPLAGSPAVDNAVSAIALDQRGIARPQGAAADIGAVERTDSDGSIHPADDALAITRRPTLVWPPVPDATGYRIHLGTETSPAFAGESELHFFEPGLLDAATTYHWKVVALTPDGPVESSIHTFTTRSDLLVTSAADTIDDNDGVTTLREAVAAAAEMDGWDRIGFSPSLAGSSLVIGSGSIPVIDQPLLIDGSDFATPITLSGNQIPTLLNISFLSDIELRNLGFTNASSNLDQAAVEVRRGSRLKAADCSFSNNRELSLSSVNAVVELLSCSFANTANGFLASSGRADLVDCTFTGHNRNAVSIISTATEVASQLSGCLFDGNANGIFLNVPSTVTSSTFRNHSQSALNWFGGGTCEISKCTFEDNPGTGITVIMPARPILVTDSIFRNNANRAIFGICVVENSSFIGNSAQNSGSGGAISSFPATITGCFFQGNYTSGRGGAVSLTGGLISNVSNSTFIDNQADEGGAIHASGRVVFSHLTVTRNRASSVGGGVFLDLYGGLEMSGCLVAGNWASYGPDAYQSTLGAAIVRNGANLIGNNDSVSGHFPEPDSPGAPNIDGDFVGTPGQPLDPLLSPPGSYGGSFPALLPLSGSPALDRIDPLHAPTTDQRGISRPQGPLADIGAVELDPGITAFFPENSESDVQRSPIFSWIAGGASGPFTVLLGTDPEFLLPAGSTTVGLLALDRLLDPSTTYYWQVIPSDGPAGPLLTFTTRRDLVVTTADDVVNESDGLTSLREAVARAALAAGHDRIVFSPVLDGQAITLASEIVIDDPSIEIDASSSAAPVTLSAGGATRLFRMIGGSELTLKNLTLSGGSDTFGAAVSLTGRSNLILAGGGISGCNASQQGGALWISGHSSVTATGTRFAMNTASYGGAVFIDGVNGPLSFESCIFEENSAYSQGGAIIFDAPTFSTDPLTELTLTGSRFRANTANFGGALWCEELIALWIDECHFDANTARNGGALFVGDRWLEDEHKAVISIANSTFSSNAANSQGGAIYASSAIITATNATFSTNFARSGGGGIQFQGGNLDLRFCTIYGNTHNSGAGGIALPGSGSLLSLRGCIVAGNGADRDIDASHAAITVLSKGGNFIGNNTSVEVPFPLPAAASEPNESGDYVGSQTSPLDPLLIPLADNGGSAPTHLFLSGALQRNHVTADFPERDQRGLPRPQGAAADIGAVEASSADNDYFHPANIGGLPLEGVTLQWCFEEEASHYQILLGTDPGALAVIGTSAIGRYAVGPFDWGTEYYWRIDAIHDGSTVEGPVQRFTARPRIVVDTASDAVDASDGVTSLPEALLAAAADANLDEIVFAPGLAGRTIILSSSQIIPAQLLKIDGSGLSSRVSIATTTNTEAIVVSGAELTIRDIDFAAITGPGAGAIQASQSTLHLENCGFTSFPKAAVQLTQSGLTVIGCRFSRNGSTTGPGGAISASSSSNLSISFSEFTWNRASTGAAIHLALGSLTIADCTFNSNRSTGGAGGAVVVTGPTAVISRTTFSGNITNGSNSDGGALSIGTSTASLGDVVFSGNLAGRHGGAIHFSGNQLGVDRSSFAGNQAGSNGGAAYFPSGSPNSNWFANCTFAGNTAGMNGGACYTPWATFFHTTITGNQCASQGGGLHSGNTLINSVVAGNTAGIGSDIFLSATLQGVNLIGNSSSLSGSFFTTGSPNFRGQFVGSPAVPLDPWLAPLADYGGKLCRPPLPGSVVIGKAPANATTDPRLLAVASIDQPGLGRPFGSAPDLGAVEARPFHAFGLVDTDDDGIDDRIEPALGLTVGVNNRGHDLDGDGQTDADELDAMTDPRNPRDRFEVLSIEPLSDFDPESNPHVTITWRSVPGVSYRLLTSRDLTAFEPLAGSDVMAAQSETSSEILLPAGHRFIQVQTAP